MKRSEQLFSIINDIDDDIIDEAKIKEEAPILMKPEPRSPIKGIIALAACIAVLAVGVFALVKFKLNSGIEPDPIQNGSELSESDSSDADSSDQMSEPTVELSDDKELQEILSGMLNEADDLYIMFGGLKETEKSYELEFDGSFQTYYPVVDGQRTYPNGLFAVPQSRAEMEELLLKYYSKRAVKSYMAQIGSGSITQSPDGTHVIHSANPTLFIEVDGKLFYTHTGVFFWNLKFDLGTVKVISKTDKTIVFQYLEPNGPNSYQKREVTLVYENNGWKLNHFIDGDVIPTDFTDEDEELQEILDELSPGQIAMCRINGSSEVASLHHFIFEGSENTENISKHYFKLSTGTFPNGKAEYPHSCGELKELMLKCLTQEAADRYIGQIGKGTITAISGDKYYVKLDKQITDTESLPPAIEIDGEMYYMYSGEINFFETAKITSKTEDSIEFIYLIKTGARYENANARTVFERGSWRLDPFYDPDNELKETLSGILSQARELDGMFNNLSANGKEYKFMFYGRHFGEDYPTYMETRTYYLVSEGQRTEPNGLFAVPQSRAEMEELLLKCFSKRAVKTYMEDFSSGSITENADGMFIAETESGYPSTFIEADGKLFYSLDGLLSGDLNFDLNTAKLISKTDKTIKFKYDTDSVYNTDEGALVYENGGWKLNHFNYDGFIPEYPTEFSEEDEMLQEILDELSPGGAIIGWFNNAGDTFYANHFVFEGLENAENYATFYVKLPTGKFDGGREEYPQSYDELTELLLKYLAQQTADWYMPRTNKGTVTSSSDKNYYIKTEKPVTSVENIPSVIEIDGEMYYAVYEKSGNGYAVWDTAKVTSQTDNSIEFTYLHSMLGGFSTKKGLIEFERDGWRINYYKVWFGSD